MHRDLARTCDFGNAAIAVKKLQLEIGSGNSEGELQAEREHNLQRSAVLLFLLDQIFALVML